MSTQVMQLRCAFPVLLLIGMLLLGTTMPARADNTYRIDAVARPARVVYGNDNNVTITVNVHDSTGGMVPDGTPVYFYTTLGTLPAMAYARGGQVTVVLENHTGAGEAIISVTIGASRQTLTVEYLGKNGVPVSQGKRLNYRLQAHQVYFSVDQKVFDLRENASFTTPTFTIKAEAIQYDVEQGLLRAQTNITITAGKESITADKLSVFLNNSSAFIVTLTPDLKFQRFTLPVLDPKDDDSAKQADYRPLASDPTRTWIICREATIFPHDQIQFRWPRFYLNNFDHLLLVLPNHVMDLKSSNANTFFNSQISLASDAGLNVDFPIYYAANSDHIGSLHLRRVTKGSDLYRGTSGMQVGIEEEYLIGYKGDGALYLDDLTNSTRSVTWQHSQDFGQTHVNLTGAYERYTLDTPYTERMGMSMSRDFGKTNFYLNTNWSAFEGSQNGVAELTMNLPPLALGRTKINFTCSPFAGTSRTVNAATSTTPVQQQDTYYEGVRTGLVFPNWTLLGGTLAPVVSNELSYNNKSTLTTYLDSGISYRKQLNREFTSSVSYTYSFSHSTNTTLVTPAAQRVSLQLSGSKAQQWDIQLYSAYSIGDDTLFGIANTTYYLPFFHAAANGQRPLYLQYNASMSAGKTTSADHLFTLGWNIGAYALLMHYSPTGNNAVTGIGSGTGKHWAIEFARQGW